jgi:tRNA modification GTPase
LDDAIARLRAALDSYSGGRVLRDGARVALLGAPNVGKSSLLNALLGMRRAIVTETPGTTRDYIEEQILLHGEFIRLIDTAGLRETSDAVEMEGIAISRETLRQADIVCLIADARDGSGNAVKLREQAAIDEFDARVLLLFNKADLVDEAAAAALRGQGIVCSALLGTGLDQLTKRLAEMARELRGSSEQGSVLVTNARHADCLRRGIDALVDAQKAQQVGMTEEVLAGDLRRAIDALGEIIGAVTTDEILNGIFSRFCIGK